MTSSTWLAVDLSSFGCFVGNTFLHWSCFSFSSRVSFRLPKKSQRIWFMLVVYKYVWFYYPHQLNIFKYYQQEENRLLLATPISTSINAESVQKLAFLFLRSR